MDRTQLAFTAAQLILATQYHSGKTHLSNTTATFQTFRIFRVPMRDCVPIPYSSKVALSSANGAIGEERE